MSKRTSENRASSCAFIFSDGRQCRMLRSSPKSKYCLHHLRKLAYMDEAEEVAIDLYQPISGNFVHHAGLTRALSLLLAHVAEGRIKSKDAIAMARVADTLLKAISLSMKDFQNTHRSQYFNQLVHRAFGKLPPFADRQQAQPQAAAQHNSDDSKPAPLPETPAEFAEQVLARLKS